MAPAPGLPAVGAIDTHLPAVQVPPQQSAPCVHAAPAAWHAALPAHLPSVQVAEQHAAPFVQASAFAVQAVAAATHLPPSQRFPQQAPLFSQTAPSGAHAPPPPGVKPPLVPPSPVEASAPASGPGGAMSELSEPQFATTRAAAIDPDTQRRARIGGTKCGGPVARLRCHA